MANNRTEERRQNLGTPFSKGEARVGGIIGGFGLGLITDMVLDGVVLITKAPEALQRWFDPTYVVNETLLKALGAANLLIPGLLIFTGYKIGNALYNRLESTHKA